jgi:hypothetical protein
MLPHEITSFLTEIFGSNIQVLGTESWQVSTPEFRLLILLSEDQTWLRTLIPIATEPEVQGVLPQLLAANFDLTQEARYALHEQVLWGVFQHNLARLTAEDFSSALGRLVAMHQRGLVECFNLMIEKQILKIIQTAKRQGQSLESTLQNLDRLYQEGVMGELDQSRQSQEETLAAWRYQLERLWPQISAESNFET